MEGLVLQLSWYMQTFTNGLRSHCGTVVCTPLRSRCMEAGRLLDCVL
jgi:hypothetical protein